MSGVPGHTPFGWAIDLSSSITSKTSEQEKWRQCMLNFKTLAQTIATQTLNTYNITPVKGGVIVGNGKTFVTVKPTADGQVLISDSTQPTGLVFKDLTALILTVLTNNVDQSDRPLLEAIVITLQEILKQLQETE